MQQFDLIIVGGGLAGASLAVALRDTPLRIALVEHQPPQRPAGWDARVYAISPANAAFLERIGAWRHLDALRMAPIRGMQVFGDAGGRLGFFRLRHRRRGTRLDRRIVADGLRILGERQAAGKPDAVLPGPARVPGFLAGCGHPWPRRWQRAVGPPAGRCRRARLVGAPGGRAGGGQHAVRGKGCRGQPGDGTAASPDRLAVVPRRWRAGLAATAGEPYLDRVVHCR